MISLPLLAPSPAPWAYNAVFLLPINQRLSLLVPFKGRQRNGSAYTGSTLPSPLAPNPLPAFHPIFFSNLFPILFSSLAGSGGGGVGAFGVGKAGPDTFGLADEEEPEGSGKGTSGWPCIIRRSEARSRYFGPVAVVAAVEL